MPKDKMLIPEKSASIFQLIERGKEYVDEEKNSHFNNVHFNLHFDSRFFRNQG